MFVSYTPLHSLTSREWTPQLREYYTYKKRRCGKNTMIANETTLRLHKSETKCQKINMYTMPIRLYEHMYV